jgi:hypothetical protein
MADARNPKYETISNDQNTKFKNDSQREHRKKDTRVSGNQEKGCQVIKRFVG